MDLGDAYLADWRSLALALEAQVHKAVLGQQRVIRLVTVAVFARGHVLLEGDVGVGKTTLLRAFARGIGGAFERLEGSIDLMPNDLIYHSYVDEAGAPRIEPGPLLRHGERLSIFFFNEINRARPQVQSLLLRAMAERSAGAYAREYRFPHLCVFADRNRVEKEETFELASAARDRFMLEVPIEAPVDAAARQALVFDPAFHDVEALLGRVAEGVVEFEQLNRVAAAIQRAIRASDSLQHYALELWQASARPRDYGIRLDGVDIDRLVLAGASPRGMSMLLQAARVAAWLEGRDYLVPEDVQGLAREALAHRIFFTPVYELRRAELVGELIQAMLERVAVP